LRRGGDEKLRKVDSGMGLASTWTSGFGVAKREVV